MEPGSGGCCPPNVHELLSCVHTPFPAVARRGANRRRVLEGPERITIRVGPSLIDHQRLWPRATSSSGVPSAVSAPSTQLVLIGLRGSGKSTVGARVGRALGRRFIDLDESVSRRAGAASVAALWTEHGEQHFRGLEARELALMIGQPNTVLSLGGGTPTAPGAADLLKAERIAGRIITCYLHVPPKVLRARLSTSDLSKRPSLTGSGVLDEIAEVYRQRDVLYRSLATFIIEARHDEQNVTEKLLAIARR